MTADFPTLIRLVDNVHWIVVSKLRSLPKAFPTWRTFTCVLSWLTHVLPYEVENMTEGFPTVTYFCVC